MSNDRVPQNQPEQTSWEPMTDDSVWERYSPELQNELVRIAEINANDRDDFFSQIKECVYQTLFHLICLDEPTTARRQKALTALKNTLLKAVALARDLDPITRRDIEQYALADRFFRRAADPSISDAELREESLESKRDIPREPPYISTRELRSSKRPKDTIVFLPTDGYWLVEDTINGAETLSHLLGMVARDLGRGKPGQPKETAIREAIRWLIGLWLAYSPIPPTLRTRTGPSPSRVYGPFYEFVEQVLRPILPTNKGFESAIRAILYGEKALRERRKNR
jgi:hypothetical protein